ncbi:MAG: MATE family efflux transporter [Christensenellales bacterium]
MQEKNNTLQSSKMRSMPMGKLLLNMSLPAIISMIIDALYSIVDSMFLSQYSQAAFEAVGISFPLVMIKISLALGIGVGANVFISRKLGEGDREGADNIARTAVFLSLLGSLLFVALAFVAPVPFMKLFSNDAEMISMGNSYLLYMLGLSVFSIVSIVAQKLLQATGNMKAPMVSQALGAIVNIILDPLFIFDEFWGIKCLNMGVTGAAIATIIGQFAACAYIILVFVVKKQDVSINLAKIKLNWSTIWNIFRIGLPTFILNALGSFTTIILNSILKAYPNGIKVLTIYFSTQSFIFMPVFGLMQGTLPILSYSLGANNRARYNDCWKRALITSAAIMAAGLLLFQIAPGLIVDIFETTPSLREDTIYAFRCISWCFLPASLSILLVTTFQSLNVGLFSMLLSMSRQLLFLIPMAYLLDYFFQMSGLFYAYPIAETVSLLIFAPIALKCYRKVFKKREEAAAGEKEDSLPVGQPTE